jgi:hypothetical protein
VVVGDPALRARGGGLAARPSDHVEQPLAENLDHPVARRRLRAVRDAATERMLAAAKHLRENIGRAPWLVIPCARGDR